MADTFTLQGRYSIQPPITNTDLSGDFEIEAPILEQLSLAKKHADVVVLSDDAVRTVYLGDVTNAHVLIIKSDGVVTAAITTALGVATLKINKILILICATAPVTAVTVQRVPGVATVCRVVVGEAL